MLLVMVECDRMCGESMDILGDRFLIEIRGDRCFGVVGLLRGRSLVRGKYGYFRRSLFD
jgi:hypothetical protein